MIRRGAAIVSIWLSLATLTWGAVAVAIILTSPLQALAFFAVCGAVAYGLVRYVDYQRQNAGILNRAAGRNLNGR